jgi:hypothetical protein
MLPEINYIDHRMSAPTMAEYMGVPVEALPEGEYAAVEQVNISTHNGTHLDAPYHFFSRMNERTVPGGEPSWRIDEVPLDWCFQPGVKLDISGQAGRLCLPARRREARAGPDRPYAATAGDRGREHRRRRTLRPGRLCRHGLRHGQGGDALDAGAGRAPRWHGCLVLGCALLPHEESGSPKQAMRA